MDLLGEAANLKKKKEKEVKGEEEEAFHHVKNPAPGYWNIKPAAVKGSKWETNDGLTFIFKQVNKSSLQCQTLLTWLTSAQWDFRLYH